MLIAAFTYAIEPRVGEQVRAQIIDRKSLTTPITISSIPLSSLIIDFISNSSEFIGNEDAKAVTGIAGATSASQ